MVRRAFILNLLWLSSTVAADTGMFEILPRVCITSVDEVCEMTLNIRWNLDNTACLVNADSPATHLFCAQETEQFSLKVNMNESMVFLLLDPDSERIVGRKHIELMRKEPRPLQQRRLSWSLF